MLKVEHMTIRQYTNQKRSTTTRYAWNQAWLLRNGSSFISR